jgi:hypothetical protein
MQNQSPNRTHNLHQTQQFITHSATLIASRCMCNAIRMPKKVQKKVKVKPANAVQLSCSKPVLTGGCPQLCF